MSVEGCRATGTISKNTNLNCRLLILRRTSPSRPPLLAVVERIFRQTFTVFGIVNEPTLLRGDGFGDRN